MRNNIVWRILVWVISIVLVGAAVFGLLLGNLRFRLFTADLYQRTLLESDVYSRSAVAVLNQAGANSDLIHALTSEQLEAVAMAIVPASYLHDMVSPAIDQTFIYLNQPDAPSEISVSAEPLRTHWQQLDIITTCIQFADDKAGICRRDLPTILEIIQTEYAPEIRIDLDEQLRPSTGTVYELIEYTEIVASRSVLFALIGVLTIGIISFILKWHTQFWQWLWKMLLISGVLVAVSAFALRVATTGLNSNIMREQGVTDDQLALAVTDFLGNIGNRFITGLLLQAGLLLLVSILIWFSAHDSRKHKQPI